MDRVAWADDFTNFMVLCNMELFLIHNCGIIMLIPVNLNSGEIIMTNQDNKFIEIDISYPCIGGDKFQQGLQEYVNSPQFYQNSFIGADSTVLRSDSAQVMNDATNSTA